MFTILNINDFVAGPPSHPDYIQYLPCSLKLQALNSANDQISKAATKLKTINAMSWPQISCGFETTCLWLRCWIRTGLVGSKPAK